MSVLGLPCKLHGEDDRAFSSCFFTPDFPIVVSSSVPVQLRLHSGEMLELLARGWMAARRALVKLLLETSAPAGLQLGPVSSALLGSELLLEF